MKNRREEKGEEGRNKIITMFGDVKKKRRGGRGYYPRDRPSSVAGRRWWVGFARGNGDVRAWRRRRRTVSCRRKGFTIEGENNGHPDPSKRDSGGKYVLGRSYALLAKWKASTGSGGGGGGGGQEAERALRVLLLTQMISRLDIQRGIL